MRTIRTSENEREFLEALVMAGGNATEACRAIGVSRTAVFEWRRADATFADAYEAALDQGTEVLEDEVARRAFQGTEKPVFYLGKECGRVREYSDTLAMFLLKARKPEKYRERIATERLGSDGRACNPEPMAFQIIKE